MLFVVRHLPTAWNRDRRLQGRRDEPILPIHDLADRLAAVRGEIEEAGPFDRVCVSTLRRTAETADALGLSDYKPDPLLDELDFGPFEGGTAAEMAERLGPQWHEDPTPLVLGESMRAFEDRLQVFRERCRAWGRVLAVGHGAWTRGMLSLCEVGSLRDMNRRQVDNMTLHAIDVGANDAKTTSTS